MHLGARVSRLGVDRLLSRLEKTGGGLLPTLRSLLFGRDDLLSTASRDLVQQGLSDALGAARRGAEEVFALLARRLEGEPGAMSPPVLRLRGDFAADPGWAARLGGALHNPLLPVSRVRGGVGDIADPRAPRDP